MELKPLFTVFMKYNLNFTTSLLGLSRECRYMSAVICFKWLLTSYWQRNNSCGFNSLFPLPGWGFRQGLVYVMS